MLECSIGGRFSQWMMQVKCAYLSNGYACNIKRKNRQRINLYVPPTYYALIPEYGSHFSRMFKVNEWSSESLLVQVPSLLKCGHGIAIDHQFRRTSKHFEIWLSIFGFWALPTNPATPALTTNVEVLGSCSHSRHRYWGFGKVECQDKRENRLRIGWQFVIPSNKVQVVGDSSSLDWVVQRMWVAHTRPEGQLR